MSVTQTFSNKVVVIQLDSFKTNVFKDSSPKEDKIFVPFFKVLILSISLTSEVYVSIIVSLGTIVREGNLSPPFCELKDQLETLKLEGLIHYNEIKQHIRQKENYIKNLVAMEAEDLISKLDKLWALLFC
jgi:hypothetical protein